MRFIPKTEQEVASEGLWPAGRYGFEILPSAGTFTTQDTTSKSGNEMIALAVKVFNENGDERVVFDYLLESVPYKLRHAAETCGLIHEYEMGVLHAEQFIGKTGYLTLKIDKDKTGQYADRNGVKDYCKPNGDAPVQAAAKLTTGVEATDNDIPF